MVLEGKAVYAFSVNGNQISYEGEDKKLLRFLREDLNLTGTKDGCSEGACGTCTVLIDGKKTKACVPSLSKLEGKSIITIEGLTEREDEVYSYCFAEAGAVQCGFCTPGMILCAKSLIDVEKNPTLDMVKKTIKGNICRCTGYKKIEEAILMAATFMREDKPVPKQEEEPKLTKKFRRVDAVEKALGTGLYTDDIRIDGMVFAKALRSAYPRARVLEIDSSEAEKHPDFIRMITASDIPENKLGHLTQDWDVFIAKGDITRYIGDAICLVVSKRRETLDEIASLVKVDYEVLKPVLSIEEALAEEAPLIHEGGNTLSVEHIVRGDADSAIANSKHVISRIYHTPYTEHAFMEPECAVALSEGKDGVLVYTSGQSIYDEQHEISRMLRLPTSKVHCHSMLVGGGFGGKEDMSVQHHAALAAWILKQPVKVKLSRQESLMVHPKRHPMDIELTTACDENGKLTAMKAVILANTGAYASLGGPVLQRACTHASGPYNFQNFDVLGKAIYTNLVPAGAFRGFGVTQSCFAVESNINLLADELGLDYWTFRRLNALKPGDIMPNGQIAGGDTGIIECLDAVKEAYFASPRSGIACALKNSGVGVGVPDSGRCILSVEQGIVHIRTSAACMGQGVATMCTQMLGETCSLKTSQMLVERPDTVRTPDSGTSTASRQTVFTGEAVKRAALQLKDALAEKMLADLEGREFYGEYTSETDPITSTKKNPVSHVAYSYSAQVVTLDESGRLENVVAACDVGTIVNMQALTGQIEGGVAMGLGYGLTEDFPMKDGYLDVKYGTLGLLRATDVPNIEVKLVEGPNKSPIAYGVKGVGELCTIPTAPACQNAYYRFDGKFRTSLPLEETAYRKKKN
ncbi:selenium-dependent molybdenum hydroxylase 1 [Sphaerochaeta pleomorpha str. Grapes]|uniref:Selenium-dependent molybdenum hydroxylase 1 n=1 Tax=Sphaerochaeta pleomorpha (strain ATCC BAA-1885 / DSM 22778 / Grapes) TaxID=158190 RepID=G8QUI2_SPHPG|nr:selenium-dependent xanthine dehydrogenase [Sphaerochaeta pleomorpha]AEV29215.1 selenium-dependent molybdenum hydroxylase 1 [Sphaerochaeta pleomorpha str. Grapes]